jgi:hypothetical protein
MRHLQYNRKLVKFQWFGHITRPNVRNGRNAEIATQFDTLPLGPLKNDQKVDFTNWQVVAGNQTTEFPHLQPYSPPNYGKLPAGKVGVFSYEEGGPEGGGGYLVSFYYGCACPLTGAPVSCTVTLLRTCYATTSTQPPITNEPCTLSYTATSNGSLTLSQTFPRKYWCLNDTLVATSLLGTPVDLYIDEYIHAEARKEA